MNGQGPSRPRTGDAAHGSLDVSAFPATAIDLAERSRDEDCAAAARARYRVEPMMPIQPDCVITPMLQSGEWLLVVRRGALLERRQPASGAAGPGLTGDLYLTSRRLLHVGRLTLAFCLDEIEEAMVSGDRLLLVLHGGTGVALDVLGPRLLRVEIATARAAARG
jgi:hypothetical protein